MHEAVTLSNVTKSVQNINSNGWHTTHVQVQAVFSIRKTHPFACVFVHLKILRWSKVTVTLSRFFLTHVLGCVLEDLYNQWQSCWLNLFSFFSFSMNYVFWSINPVTLSSSRWFTHFHWWHNQCWWHIHVLLHVVSLATHTHTHLRKKERISEKHNKYQKVFHIMA